MTKQESTHSIFPELEKFQGFSHSMDDEQGKFSISNSDYEQVRLMIDNLEIDDKIDNLCYVLWILKQVASSVKVRRIAKPQYDIFDQDRLETAKYLKLVKEDNDLFISKIKFDVAKKTGYNSKLHKYEYTKEDSFTIQDQRIIVEIIKTVLNKYGYKSSIEEDYQARIKKQGYYRKDSSLRKMTAHSLFHYLSKNTSLGERKKYHVIGLFFQLSNIETELSETKYSSKVLKAHKSPYKNYADFIISNIRNKYFK